MTDKTTGLDGVLAQDDVIDALSDRQIHDIYVREKLMKTIMKARGPRYLSDPQSDQDAYELGEMHSGVFRMILHRHRDYLDARIARDLSGADSYDNVETLWHKFTDHTDWPEERRQKAVRAHLKESLRCTGMPSVIVARTRVNYHRDFPDEFTDE